MVRPPRTTSSRGVVAQSTQLGGMTQERERSVADEIDRRFMAGDQEQHAGREQLVLAELVPRLLGGDEAGEQVGARRGASLGDEGAEILGQGSSRPCPTLRHVRFRRQEEGVQAPRDVQTPLLETLPIRRRDAEHLADHDDRKGIGEVLDEVHPARALHGVEETVDDLLDPGTQHLYDARGERLVDEAAQARVVGRVAHEHRQTHRRRGSTVAGGYEGLDAFLAQARIAQHAHHVFVAGEDPEPERAAMHRIVGAQAMVGGIRIRHELGIHRVELHLGHGAAKLPLGGGAVKDEQAIVLRATRRR